MAINPDELRRVLETHRAWLQFQDDGERADLRWADLSRAEPKGIRWFSVGPLGSRNDMLSVRYVPGEPLRLNTGCRRNDTLAEFEEAVKETHGDNQHGREYRVVIEMLRVLFEEAQS